MKTNAKITAVISIAAVFAFSVGGCVSGTRPVMRSTDQIGDTIGSLTEAFVVDAIAVEGYGVVGALSGTGSSECPPQLKEYLKQFILSRSSTADVDVEKLLRGRDTAVVYLKGIMPASARQGHPFDVKIEALSGTQTSSLEGGWLYNSELKQSGTFGVSTRRLAKVEGPVFIDTVGTAAVDKRSGYVLGGGKVRDKYPVTLTLRRPDFMTARAISDIINSRFGGSTAHASSDGVVELSVPIEYAGQQERFVGIVQVTYLSSSVELAEERTTLHAEGLANSENKYANELALEAMGFTSLGKLGVLLSSPNEEVRFRAARCILNLRGGAGLEVLRAMALDRRSKYRVEALEALSTGANRIDAAGVCRQLLQDPEFNIRLAAYKQLRKLDDITISQEVIGERFYLEQIAHSKTKEIYVSRKGIPRIVLFGAPIVCRDNIFVQSANGEVTINAPSGQKHVTLMRKLRGSTDPVILRSSFNLSDIIRKLCEEPLEKKGILVRAGLNVPYAQAIELIKQLCDTGAAPAALRLGEMPEIE
jgi:hypothetical protein